ALPEDPARLRRPAGWAAHSWAAGSWAAAAERTAGRRTVVSRHRSRLPLHHVADRGRYRLDVRRELGRVLDECRGWLDQPLRKDPPERVWPVCPPVDGHGSPRPDES